VIVWLWDAPGPARTTRGVTGSQTRARQAAEALITGGQAHGAVLEQAVLGLGAGSMTYGYQRTGRSWHALIRGLLGLRLRKAYRSASGPTGRGIPLERGESWINSFRQLIEAIRVLDRTQQLDYNAESSHKIINHESSAVILRVANATSTH
jgi:hypothetical protein